MKAGIDGGEESQYTPRIGRKSLRVGPSVLMSGSLSSSVSGRASRDALVAAACHYRAVNLPTL